MSEFEETPPEPPRPKPSKTPSWIMLGFLLGALFMWKLPRLKPTPPAAPSISAPAVPKVATRPRMTDVEAAFEAYRQYALWTNDGITYVCFWDGVETQTFRDCFQVLQRGEELFFRSVPRPANLRAREDVPKECPLQFLNPAPETEARGVLTLPLPRSTPAAPSN
jgi:hypothetical protein